MGERGLSMSAVRYKATEAVAGVVVVVVVVVVVGVVVMVVVMVVDNGGLAVSKQLCMLMMLKIIETRRYDYHACVRVCV